jgi:hypothetical protein
MHDSDKRFRRLFIVISCQSSGQSFNDADLANMRAQCHRYSQQIDVLQAQIPVDIQKVRR